MQGRSVFWTQFTAGSVPVRPGLPLFHLRCRLRQKVGHAMDAQHGSLPQLQTHGVINNTKVHINRATIFTPKTFMGS